MIQENDAVKLHNSTVLARHKIEIFCPSCNSDVDEAAQNLSNAGYPKFAEWILAQKKTEAYVRFNGKVFTMGAYQVFNPLTGIHTRYETEAEAKAALVEIAKQVLQQHCPTVVQELSNENGDTCWISTKLNETLIIS